MATFSEFVQAQAHQEEIRATRVGGLGGSDAAMVLRVALRGLSALTATDTKRLCVMMGTAEGDQWGGNAYTNAGHAFEDYAEQHLPLGNTYEREKKIERKLALNFDTFAHADFYFGDDAVCECKYVQKPTDKVLSTYAEQIQWYYMLGAKQVFLYHGQGNVDPFEVEDAAIVAVGRNERMIELLIDGIKIIDQAITDGWRPEIPDKVGVQELPMLVSDAFAELAQIKEEEAMLKVRKDAATSVLKEYMEAMGYNGIVGEEKTIVYTRATVGRTFDVAKFLQAHPEYAKVDEYWKEIKRASSISMK